MNRMADAAMDLDLSGTRLLITPPRRRILLIGGIFLAIELLLFTLTNRFIGIITVPLIFIWCFLYHFYCKIWRSYDYSWFYLIAAPALTVVASVGMKYLLYRLF